MSRPLPPGVVHLRGKYPAYLHIRCTYEERARWNLAAGKEGFSGWLRRLLNAACVVERGMDVEGVDFDEARAVLDEPIVDRQAFEVAVRGELSRRLELLKSERESYLKEKNPLSRVLLCTDTGLPVFACECEECVS